MRKISYCHPVVYRFIEDEYIDEFFNTGALRLASMASLKKNRSTLREDIEEGEYLFYFKDDAGCVVGVDADIGQNAFVLSTATSLAASHEKSRPHCLEIRDVEKLAINVSEKLELEHGLNVKEIILGPCNYSERMRIITLPPGKKFEEIGVKYCHAGQDEIIDGELLYGAIRSQFYDRVCFTKPARLMNEHEFRIVWLVDMEVDSPVIVHVDSPHELAVKIKGI